MWSRCSQHWVNLRQGGTLGRQLTYSNTEIFELWAIVGGSKSRRRSWSGALYRAVGGGSGSVRPISPGLTVQMSSGRAVYSKLSLLISADLAPPPSLNHTHVSTAPVYTGRVADERLMSGFQHYVTTRVRFVQKAVGVGPSPLLPFPPQVSEIFCSRRWNSRRDAGRWDTMMLAANSRHDGIAARPRYWDVQASEA